MPAIAQQIIDAMLSGGLLQYPDRETYKAATLLQPAERPTVPVRMVNPVDVYNGPHVQDNTTQAFVLPARDTVYVSKKGQYLRDPKSLAAILAHEQIHVAGDAGEAGAYQRQYDVLKRLTNDGYRYRDQLTNYLQTAQLLRDAEKRQQIKK